MTKEQSLTLILQLMNNIIFHTNVLPNKLIKEIKTYVQDTVQDKRWQTSYHWPEFIRRTPYIPILSLDQNLSIYNQVRKIFSKLFPPSKKFGMQVNYYRWPPHSYIPMHDDGHRVAAATIYLNKEWYPNWGGLFLYKREEDPQINTFFPSYNCCVINNNQILHGTSAVTSEAQDRETVQVFWYERSDVK
tara:strand:- start:831 stop:1397 length:567 start_codon:yes stop_codon:yes gene_type:complete